VIKLEADLWINKDTIAVAQKKVFSSAGLSEECMKPYSLLSWQLLLCGFMLFHLNLIMQDAGITLVNA